jgi:hypothetical protein
MGPASASSSLTTRPARLDDVVENPALVSDTGRTARWASQHHSCRPRGVMPLQARGPPRRPRPTSNPDGAFFIAVAAPEQARLVHRAWIAPVAGATASACPRQGLSACEALRLRPSRFVIDVLCSIRTDACTCARADLGQAGAPRGAIAAGARRRAGARVPHSIGIHCSPPGPCLTGNDPPMS